MSGVVVAGHSPGQPETLWHYAPAAAFRGIITSKTLWASDTLRMTDTTEFSYPREVLIRVIERMDAHAVTGYERWILALAKIIAESETGPTVYAACTSEASDVWSQWDVFVEGGTGFAIGLDRSLLYESAKQQGYSLCRMIYSVSEQEDHYETVLRDAVAIVPDVEQDMGHGPGLALLLALAFSYPLTFVKNHNLAKEGEWRLMRLDSHLDATPVPKVRQPGIRYEEVSLDSATTGESAIVSVVAGSAARPEAIDKARHLLDQHGLAHVPVHRSTSFP